MVKSRAFLRYYPPDLLYSRELIHSKMIFLNVSTSSAVRNMSSKQSLIPTEKNNWPSLNESVNMKSPPKKIPKTKCYIRPSSTISRVHRIEQPATLDILKLPRVMPKTGVIPDKIFKTLITKIDTYTSEKHLKKSSVKCGTKLSLGEFLTSSQKTVINNITTRNFLEERGKKATVKNKITGSRIYNQDLRSCYRLTSRKLPTVISPLLEKEFSKSFGDEVLETRIHPEHCDLLLYNEGDFFGFHKDQVLDFPFLEKVTPESTMRLFGEKLHMKKEVFRYKESRGYWYMYSVILCIDSNLKSQSLRDDGNTIVCLPSKSFTENPSLLKELFKPGNSFAQSTNDLSPISLIAIKKKKLVPHVFHQSITPGNFVIFPSTATHASAAITQNGGYKMALKMDLWVLIPNSKMNESIASSIQLKFLNSHIPRPKFLQHGPGSALCKIVPEFHKKSPTCLCKLCNPRQVEIKHIHQNLTSFFTKTLSSDIWSVVASYLDISIRKTRPSSSFLIKNVLKARKIRQSTTKFKHSLNFMEWESKEWGEERFHYKDYYEYLSDRFSLPRHLRTDCICSRICTNLDKVHKYRFQFYENVCECTCVGCLLECCVDTEPMDDESDYYDSEPHCNDNSSDSDY